MLSSHRSQKGLGEITGRWVRLFGKGGGRSEELPASRQHLCLCQQVKSFDKIGRPFFLLLFVFCFFLNVFILLCSDQSYVISFVVPNHKLLMAVAERLKVRGSWEELCNNPQIEKEVLRILNEAAISCRGVFGPLFFPIFIYLFIFKTCRRIISIKKKKKGKICK